MKFLAKVASYSEYNKVRSVELCAANVLSPFAALLTVSQMPLHNVATVFAPNILRRKDATMFQGWWLYCTLRV
jgi:hypothetical protein